MIGSSRVPDFTILQQSDPSFFRMPWEADKNKEEGGQNPFSNPPPVYDNRDYKNEK